VEAFGRGYFLRLVLRVVKGRSAGWLIVGEGGRSSSRTAALAQRRFERKNSEGSAGRFFFLCRTTPSSATAEHGAAPAWWVGKAAAEAGAVTCGAVRCSAWLGFIAVGSAGSVFWAKVVGCPSSSPSALHDAFRIADFCGGFFGLVITGEGG